MTHFLRLPALLALVAVTACGQESPAVEDELGPVPYPPDALVLQVRSSGGFVPVGEDFRSLPAVSLYGDGRVVLPDPEIAVYPGPALPSAQLGQVEPEQVLQLVDDGRAALEDGGDYGRPPIADAPTTVVVVGAGKQRELATAEALSVGLDGLDPSRGLTPAQQAARERLSAYVQQVQQAAGSVDTVPYEPEGLAVLALPYGDVPALEGLEPEEQAWPGPPLAGGGNGTPDPSRCVIVTEELDAVLEAAEDATQETVWLDGGERWRLVFRPLLPSEATCDDVLGGPPGGAP